MGRVTIYVGDSALDAAKRAAERAQVSVSQWFAKFAIEEKNKQVQNWDVFFAEKMWTSSSAPRCCGS